MKINRKRNHDETPNKKAVRVLLYALAALILAKGLAILAACVPSLVAPLVEKLIVRIGPTVEVTQCDGCHTKPSSS